MSTHEGKKILRAFDAFRDAIKPGQASPLLSAARALKYRTLGERQLNELSAYLNDTRKYAHIKIFDNFRDNKSARVADRKIVYNSVYMSVRADVDGQPVHDYYFPVVNLTKATPEYVTHAQRPMPVAFFSDHTEFRFVQRTAKVLDYSHDDFRLALATMLAMVSVDNLLVKNDASVPVVTPHAHGFFLGHASKANQNDYIAYEGFTAVRKGKDGKPAFAGLEPHEILIPGWTPHAAFTFYTFVSEREFTEPQKKLHEAFKTLLRKPDAVKALYALLNMYPFGKLPNPEENAQIGRLKAELIKIVASPEWQNEQKHGLPHMLKHELH